MPHRANHSGHLALVVCHPARTGGMETFCKFLAETVLDAGWRVTVALSGENIYDSLQASHGRSLKIKPVEWLDATCAGDREYGRARILERRRWFARLRPDVALFVQSSNTPFRAAIAGARLAGVPVISTHRTMAWPVEHVPSRRHFFGLLPGIGLHRRRVIFKTWLAAFLAARVVYNSAEVARGYEALYHYPRHRRVVIPNAVTPVSSGQPANFRVAASCRSPGKRNCPQEAPITIGYAGRIGADKRIDILLRAVAAMQSRDVRVRIFGEGAERPLLADLAARLRIADRVEWRGVTQDIWSAYADMDIVALCSPRESSSNMVLEAMAAGKAVVATDAGGTPELIEPGTCGLCVPALDVSALAVALDRLAVDVDLRRRLGESARAKALRVHDPRKVAAQWMALLNTVAGRPLAASRHAACPEAFPTLLAQRWEVRSQK